VTSPPATGPEGQPPASTIQRRALVGWQRPRKLQTQTGSLELCRLTQQICS
jgi:hypothetical protein